VALNPEERDVLSSLRIPGILAWSIDRAESLCMPYTTDDNISNINYISHEILIVHAILLRAKRENTLNDIT